MMSLDFWITLWKLVLLAGIALFAALAVVVTIGGARDIVKLLHSLRVQQAEDSDTPD